MGNKAGAYLGGIRTLEDLRLRSHVDDVTGCWCYRLYLNANGLAYVRATVDGVQVKALGRRAALLLAGSKPKPGQVAYPKADCFTTECVNPKHARWGSTRDRMRLHAARGMFSTPERRLMLITNGRQASKLSDEQRLEVSMSNEPPTQAAARLGISKERVSQLRRGMKTKLATTVFDWRP